MLVSMQKLARLKSIVLRELREQHSPNHLVYFFVGELLAQIGHDVAQLGRRDESVAVLVEDAKRLANLLLAICVFHFARHHRKELGKVYCAVT
jgi:hypothetical protein